MFRISLSTMLLLLVPAQVAVTASPALAAKTVHVVLPGETVWTIARQHGLPSNLIVRTNRLQNPDRLRIGDRLAVPVLARRGASRATQPSATPRQKNTHLIRPGDNLWSVARRHDISVDALARLNRLAEPDRVRPGQRILLPSTPMAQTRPRRLANQAAPTAPPRLRLRWSWPSRGVITSRFGYRGRRHHHGIDIAAPIGTPIFAVRPGTVQFAGRRGAYGLLVILDHGDGLTTWYGHASRIFVAVGSAVRPGGPHCCGGDDRQGDRA